MTHTITEGMNTVTLADGRKVTLRLDAAASSYTLFVEDVDGVNDCDGVYMECVVLGRDYSAATQDAYDEGAALVIEFTDKELATAADEFISFYEACIESQADDADYETMVAELHIEEERDERASQALKSFSDYVISNWDTLDIRHPSELQYVWNGFRRNNPALIAGTELFSWRDITGRGEVWAIEHKAQVAQIVTSTEAESLLGLAPGSVRQACGRGQWRTARMAGGVWLVHISEVWAKKHDSMLMKDDFAYDDEGTPAQ